METLGDGIELTGVAFIFLKYAVNPFTYPKPTFTCKCFELEISAF